MTVRAQLTFPADTAIPADATSITFHFAATKADPAGANIKDALMSFWTGANTTRKISDYLSEAVDQGNTRIRLYDLADPEPRVPFLDDVVAFGEPASSAKLPPELALCVSYQATRISGLDQANRRGRLYIGPLNSLAMGASPNDRPSPLFIADLKSAATRLMTEAAADNVHWCVYSPTLGTNAIVHDGWVDNDFDIQRKRGLGATTRNVWS